MKKLLAFIFAFMLLFTATLAETPAEENAETVIPLETLVMSDGFTFAMPAEWGYATLTQDMLDKGVFMICGDEEANINIIGVMEGVAPTMTTDQLADAMTKKDYSFYNVKMVTNDMGYDVILYISSDYATMGYCVLDGKGYMINFLFGHADDTTVEKDELLVQLVSDCAQRTGYTPLEEAAEETPAE